MSTRHTMLCAQDEAPQQRYQVYHEERTKGGISLTMSGASYAEVLADEGIKVKFTFGG